MMAVKRIVLLQLPQLELGDRQRVAEHRDAPDFQRKRGIVLHLLLDGEIFVDRSVEFAGCQNQIGFMHSDSGWWYALHERERVVESRDITDRCGIARDERERFRIAGVSSQKDPICAE